MAQKDGSVQNETFVARIKDAVPVAEGKKKCEHASTPLPANTTS
jgi:hypothetical protein